MAHNYRQLCAICMEYFGTSARVARGYGFHTVAGGMATPSSYGGKGLARNAEALRLRLRLRHGRPAAAGSACGARQAWDAAHRAAGTLGETQVLGRSWEAWRWPQNP
jgi:hypothetical protein